MEKIFPNRWWFCVIEILLHSCILIDKLALEKSPNSNEEAKKKKDIFL